LSILIIYTSAIFILPPLRVVAELLLNVVSYISIKLIKLED